MDSESIRLIPYGLRHVPDPEYEADCELLRRMPGAILAVVNAQCYRMLISRLMVEEALGIRPMRDSIFAYSYSRCSR